MKVYPTYAHVVKEIGRGNFAVLEGHEANEDLIRWIRFHHLGPLVYYHYPPLRDAFLLDWATSLNRWKVWREARPKLIKSPVPVAVFKGVALGRFYPKPETRFISDVDLWVKKEDLDELDEYLKGEGFRHVMDVPGQRIFRYRGLPFEVHVKFTRFPYPDLKTETILYHLIQWEGNLFVPDKDLSLSLLYLHAYKSMYVKTSFKALWWYDELLLRERGAQPIGGTRILKAANWFASVSERDLRSTLLSSSLLNSLLYYLHGIKLFL
ncbi:MAG: nucleotidyltransferase family protein [Thermotogae bacterium]|nr:nucleotidyltransferase family protein [Thermotogota bacterium]